ncbi:MAG TPA: malto-oligosyltrehalose trehalohydrolase [Puia sp.]|jgi:maltooligosyltrehalose trehalohydrolase
MDSKMNTGADHSKARIFSVWAPEKKTMTLHLTGPRDAGRDIVMQKDPAGYFHIGVEGVKAGDRYFFTPDKGKRYPDPASHYQPEGVHGPSEIVDHARYAWKDEDWKGLPFADLIFYELHVGTFTPEGTFESMIPRLEELAATGINAIELMPVAQCPGNRNWGYDAVYPYAVQNSYGGPEGLKKLVDACHRCGIAVFLDVVYNHMGAEGNYLPFFGPYFSTTYRTPWGDALNFDGPWSDGVRQYVIGNVLYWAEYYHVDGLRLDAIHEIFDRNAISIWEDLQKAVKTWQEGSGRPLYLVAESDLNSPRVVRSPDQGGYGFDAQWMDDFHHALYVLLDEEGRKHYQDFGRLEQFAKAYTEGFVHTGEYVWFRHRKHGAGSAGINGEKFIVFNQNHDLPGNRPGGERLSVLVDIERLKLAAAAVLLSPYVPLLFMGEEYGEEAPFYFFSDYGDPDIAAGLSEGRKKQFAAFEWEEVPPDSQDEAVFTRSKLQWERRNSGKHRVLLEWHRQLIALRRGEPLLRDLSRDRIRADLLGTAGLAVHRHSTDGSRQLVCLFNFSKEELRAAIPYGGGQGPWTRQLDAGDTLPERVATGETLRLPPWGAGVYTLNL